MEVKAFAAEFKAGKDGRFTAIANQYGVVDGGGDRTMPGAASADLRARGPYRPLLWSHKSDEIVGLVKLSEKAGVGLVVDEGVVNMDVRRGAEAWSLLTMEPVSPIGGLSIGYATRRERYDGGVRELHEIEIWEVSLVMAPMNQGSVVTSVAKSDLDALVREIRRLNHEIRDEAGRTTADEIADVFRRARLECR